jgi:hypothetical protein
MQFTAIAPQWSGTSGRSLYDTFHIIDPADQYELTLTDKFLTDDIRISEANLEEIADFGVRKYIIGMDKVYYTSKTDTTFTLGSDSRGSDYGGVRNHKTGMTVKGDVTSDHFCGTYNYDGSFNTGTVYQDGFPTAHPSLGARPIHNESVTKGMNAEYPAHPESGFMRCNKCGFPLNRHAHPKGWGDGISQPSTTLDGGVNKGDTTITVASTTGFPSSGYLFIYETGVGIGAGQQ